MKKINTTLIITGGILNILGAIFHFALWFILDWENTLSVLTTLNSNVMILLNYCLAIFFLFFGIILIWFRYEILTSKLGKAILFSIGTVYLVRLSLEFILPESNIVTGGILLIYLACHLIPLFLPVYSKRDTEFSLH